MSAALIQPEELEGLSSRRPGSVLILDCRFRLDEPEWGEARYREGHLPGARYISIHHDLAGPLGERGPLGPAGGRHPLPEPEVLAARLRGLGLNPGDQVVAYDDAGGCYAARLWWTLRWLGHEEVAVLQGGITGWAASGRSLEAGEPPPRAEGRWQARPDPSRLVGFSEVAAGGMVLVDCRAGERYRGEVETIDPVAGHIPGAINRPWTACLDTRKGLVRAPELPPGDAVLYCGSGVTACAVALVMEESGRPYRLYMGSWSDWVARGGAVATGEEG